MPASMSAHAVTRWPGSLPSIRPVKTKSRETARLTVASAGDCRHCGPWTSAQKHATAMRIPVTASHGRRACQTASRAGHRFASRPSTALSRQVLFPGNASEGMVARILIRLLSGPLKGRSSSSAMCTASQVNGKAAVPLLCRRGRGRREASLPTVGGEPCGAVPPHTVTIQGRPNANNPDLTTQAYRVPDHLSLTANHSSSPTSRKKSSIGPAAGAASRRRCRAGRVTAAFATASRAVVG